MKTKMIVGNMKMNLEKKEIFDYVEKVKNIQNENVVFCPSSLYLPYFLKYPLHLGIQNIFYEDLGAYTGETSALQAKSLGVEYVLIGHSERRTIFKEDEEQLEKKLRSAFRNHLKVIYCIGESDEEHQKDKTEEVLSKELDILKKLQEEIDSNLFIAYEPVWAIGTGKVPDNPYIQKIALFIKDKVKEKTNKEVPVFYGGSINEFNIRLLNEIEEIDGFLVGGASTKVETFKNLIEVVVSQ